MPSDIQTFPNVSFFVTSLARKFAPLTKVGTTVLCEDAFFRANHASPTKNVLPAAPLIGTTRPNQAYALSKPLIRLRTAQVGLRRCRADTRHPGHVAQGESEKSGHWMETNMHASGRARREASYSRRFKLIEPNLERDRSLAEALRARRTVREFSDEALSPQTLGDLLPAACGINRLNGPFGVVGRSTSCPCFTSTG